MKRRTLLITGASGFTGRHACSYFAQKGVRVIAVVRRKGAMPSQLEVVERVCELTDKQQVQQLISQEQPDDVLHLAGNNSVPESWKHPLMFIETNVLATLYLLDAMRIYPESRIVIVGSRLTFELDRSPQPPHPYSLSKTIEMVSVQSWMHLFKQHVLLAEPSNLIGPGPSTGICSLLGRHIVQVERGLTEYSFHLSSPHETRDFLDVRDAVRAYEVLLSLGTPGEIYPINSGIERTLGSIAERMLQISDISIPPEVIEQIKSSNLQHKHITHSPRSQLHQLGWDTTFSIHQSLQDVIQYYRAGEGG